MTVKLKEGKRCGNCGSLETAFKPTRGPFRWKDYKGVYLKKPISLLTCKRCGERLLSPQDIDVMDEKIEESIRTQAQEFIDQILKREGCRQIDLAAIAGLSAEHLSAIKNKTRTPSFQTLIVLYTFAVNESAFRDAANFPKAASA